MAILVSAHQIKKSFGPRPLFEDLTFAIESGERIGLIGPNGAGKSTLLRVLAGEYPVDEGRLSLQKGLRIGFLEQVPRFSSGATVQSVIEGGVANPDDWESIGLAQELMSRLLLDTLESGPATPVEQLSGGWQKRVALARELAKKPDLLLLDEPTNHLDVEGILWLEEFLARAPFATLTITHDRAFLQKVANRILELDRRNPGGLLSVNGGYVDYLEAKEQALSSQERLELILKNTLRRETEWLRRGAKARTTKQQARIQRAEQLKDEVSELEYRNLSRNARIDFQSAEKSPKKLIEAKEISKSYDGRKLFSRLNVSIRSGSRIGLLGPNGCGKSTLLRVLVGQEPPDSGQVARSESLSIAYFQQTRDTLDPEATVLKALCPTGDQVHYRGSPVHVRSYLDRFLFNPMQMEMSVGRLSGGEQSRLLIAKLMLQEANLLVLDEPTNDLDMATLTVLEDALLDFPGAVLLVTHDRYFLDQVANQILAFSGEDSRDGNVVSFEGLGQWEDWHHQQAARAREEAAQKRVPSQAAPQAASSRADAAAGGGKRRKLSYMEQREWDSMEETIQEVERQLAELVAESERPEISTHAIRLAELTSQMSQLQTQLDQLYERWAELEAKQAPQ